MNSPLFNVRMPPELAEAFRSKLEIVASTASVAETLRGFCYVFVAMDDQAAREAIRSGRRAMVQFREQLEMEERNVAGDP